MQHFSFLLTLLLFVIWSQQIPTAASPGTNPYSELAPNTAIIILAEKDKQVLSLNDFWKKVKSSIVIAWNNLKVIANNTKTKLNTWLTNLKKRAEEINNAFVEKIQEVKVKINNLIDNILDGEIVKQCIKQQTEVIDNLLIELIQRTSECLRNNMGIHSILKARLEIIELNETEYMEQLENKYQECEKDSENLVTCLIKVRDDSFNDIDNSEYLLYQNQIESRTVLDNILEALVACSIDGLIEASSVAATEALIINKCIIKGSQNSTTAITCN